MSEMIERVARNLYELKRTNLPAATWLPPWVDIGEAQSGYLAEARMAIVTMREPTDWMEQAGGDYLANNYPAAAATWRAMIDAALA